MVEKRGKGDLRINTACYKETTQLLQKKAMSNASTRVLQDSNKLARK